MKVGQKIILGLVGVLSFGLVSMTMLSNYSYAEGVKIRYVKILMGGGR